MTDTQEPLSNLSDASFVILGQGSLALEANEETCKTPNFSSLTNNYAYSISESIKSTTSNKSQNNCFAENNFSEETIQKKLDELLKENYQLKEILAQNNLAIKSQLSAFFMWQQEVLKTHESHKEKFLETKDLILKLRAENMSLKKQLKDCIGNGSFVNDTEIYSQVNKKPGELNSLKEKVKEYEKACSDLIEKNEEIKMENQRIKEDLKSSKIEILKLNKELDDFGRENMILRQKNNYSNKDSFESLSHKSLPNSEARAQIANLLKQLDEEKDKVSRLKEELKNVKCTNAKPSDLKLSPTEQLNQNLDKLNNMSVSLNKQNQQFSSSQSWVSVAEENMKQNEISKNSLIFEINEAKTHLHQEENISTEREALEKLRKQYYSLLDDYKFLQQQLNVVKNNDLSVEKYKEEISSLLAKLEDRDKQLALKQQECDSLQEDIKKCSLECEKVALLKIQAELYQDDFNIERDAREKIAGEKEELLERVRFLESELKHLQLGNETEKAKSSKTVEYTCPHCVLTFSDHESLVNHISSCLNSLF